jgi:hypothetical protein
MDAIFGSGMVETESEVHPMSDALRKRETTAAIREMRNRVFMEQSGLCWWCKKSMVLTEDRGNPLRMELAHRIGQGSTNLRKWGAEVIHHRLNICGCHPGECNTKATINPNTLWAENHVLDIRRALRRERERRYAR